MNVRNSISSPLFLFTPQAGHLQLAQSCLETYFAETSR